MREISVREVNQNFSQVIAAAERGETIVVTKNDRPVARTPQSQDRASDPEPRIGSPRRGHHRGR
jgi:antitoxin (DNA-binding transcriptional repressor) of toxin-antitoxin stability system